MSRYLCVLILLVSHAATSVRLPLTCSDLTYDNVFTLSHAGSHHFLSTNATQFGLGPLRYRQFSDWKPGGPLFLQLAQLSASVPTHIDDLGNSQYTWRPDFADWSGRVGALQVQQRVGYVAQDKILGLVHLNNSHPAKGPVTGMQLSGKVTNKITTCTITEAEGPNGEIGVNLALTATLPNLWGNPAEVLNLRVAILVNITKKMGGSVSINADEKEYSIHLPSLDHSGTVAIMLDIMEQQQQQEKEEKKEKEYHDYQTATFFSSLLTRTNPFSVTTSTVNHWLSLVKQPPLQLLPPPTAAGEGGGGGTAAVGGGGNHNNSTRTTSLLSTSSTLHYLRVYYNAWYQFWYNTEHSYANWTHTVITPSKSTYGRGMWLWDSGFHIMALLQSSPSSSSSLSSSSGSGGGMMMDGIQLAANQVKVLVHGSAIVHHLPREVWAKSVGNDIQPPGILTWASLLIYNKTGSLPFIQEIYSGLGSNNDWYYAHQDSNHDGLCEWAGTQSGWDTSPRWDHGPVEAIDLNCWLYLDQLYLAEMAKLLGKGSDVTKWKKKAEKTKQLIRNNLWDHTDGVYYDRIPKTKQFVKVRTPATYWAMLVGIASSSEASLMMKQFYNHSQLGTAYPMPCVSRSSPKFEPTNYWRGPTWINVNWLSLLAWKRYGYHKEAEQLRSDSVSLIGMHPVPREYYDPLTGAGLGAENYMWTGALYIVMTQEQSHPHLPCFNDESPP